MAALAIGAKLGGDLGQRFDHYLRIAPQVLCFLQSYWLPNQRFILANSTSHLTSRPPSSSRTRRD